MSINKRSADTNKSSHFWGTIKRLDYQKNPKHLNYIFLLHSIAAAVEDTNSLRAPALPKCDEDRLVSFLAEIQAINPESIVRLSTDAELDQLCKKVSMNLDRTNKYLSTCTLENQPDLYLQLIKGVESLTNKICKEGQFKKDFRSHYACYRDLKPDYEDCVGPADWNEDSDQDLICRAYKDIADCYYVKTLKICGARAAIIMKELTLSVIDSIITVKCDQVRKNPPLGNYNKTQSLKDFLKAEMLIVCVFIHAIYYTNCTFLI